MKKIFLIGILMGSNFAFAGPIYSSHCQVAKDIQNPEGSSGFYMSADCKTAFILPPASGVTTIVGHTSGNLKRCKEVDSFNKNLKQINKEINQALKSTENMEEIKRLYDLRSLTLEQYSDLSNTQGASIEMNFSMAISENLIAYQDLNSHVSVHFSPVVIKNVKLAWNELEKIDPSMKIAFNKSIPVPTSDINGSGSFNGRLDLSLFGACPLQDPFTQAFPKKLKLKNLAGLITPNVVYEYDLEATYKYTASYNLSTLASKIKKNSTSGGLFKTSSTSKLIETNESDSYFKFDMECDDQRICEQAKTETAFNIKLRLMKEVFDNISVTTLGYNPILANIPTPGASGAQTAADALRKCPDTYCQAGAVVLDIAQSIFGGSSATEEYIKRNDHWAEEKVTEKRPVSFSGVMGFKG
jgi:flagellar hook-basal body complex protein FliE